MKNNNEIHGNHDNITFPNIYRVHELVELDEEKFREELDKLMNFLNEKANKDEVAVLYIERLDNIILYGNYEAGFKREAGRVELMNNENLKGIYELIKVEFADTFKEGCTHSSVEGWSLLSTLNKDVLVHIESQNRFDTHWIYEEVTKSLQQLNGKNEQKK